MFQSADSMGGELGSLGPLGSLTCHDLVGTAQLFGLFKVGELPNLVTTNIAMENHRKAIGKP